MQEWFLYKRGKIYPMLLFNENHQQLDIEKLKARLLNGITKEEKYLQPEIETLLGNYYGQAFNSEAKAYNYETTTLKTYLSPNFSLANIGKKLLVKIKQFICGVLTAGSTATEIVDMVLQSLSSIIPGGIIVEFVVQKIVNYIVGIGVTAICEGVENNITSAGHCY